MNSDLVAWGVAPIVVANVLSFFVAALYSWLAAGVLQLVGGGVSVAMIRRGLA